MIRFDHQVLRSLHFIPVVSNFRLTAIDVKLQTNAKFSIPLLAFMKLRINNKSSQKLPNTPVCQHQ